MIMAKYFFKSWLPSPEKVNHRVHMINKGILVGVFHQIIHWIESFEHGAY